MQRVVVVSLFMAFMAPLAQAEVKWSGGSGIRHRIQKSNDGLSSTNTLGRDQSKKTEKFWELRGAVGASEAGETIDWQVGIRTQSSASSEWRTVQNNGDIGIGLEVANLRAHTNFWDSDWAVTIGRQKSILFYDTIGQSLFDRDNRWDGFGWTWKAGNFGFNATQYVLGAFDGSAGAVQSSSFDYTQADEAGAQTQSHFGILYSFQPHITFSVSEDIKALFAVAYHQYSGTGGNLTTGWYTNAVHGGVANSSAGTAVGNVNPVIVDNARQWHAFTDWTLPYSLKFMGEYVRNKKVRYGTRTTPTTVTADHDAFALTLLYGATKKKNDFSLSYTYGDKGIGSVVGTFTNGDVAPDNRSHIGEVKYALEQGLVLGWKGIFTSEKAKLGGDGQPLTAPNNNRKQTRSRHEFSASLSF